MTPPPLLRKRGDEDTSVKRERERVWTWFLPCLLTSFFNLWCSMLYYWILLLLLSIFLLLSLSQFVNLWIIVEYHFYVLMFATKVDLVCITSHIYLVTKLSLWHGCGYPWVPTEPSPFKSILWGVLRIKEMT